MVVGVSGCTPDRKLTSPVGEWVAAGDDRGVLEIRKDGTFTVSGASYNPIQDRDAADDFNASGTWDLARDDTQLSLDFTEAAQGDFAVQPGGFFLEFASGVIRFHDPDEVLGIEFRIDR